MDRETEGQLFRDLGCSAKEIEDEWDRLRQESRDSDGREDLVSSLMSDHEDMQWIDEGIMAGHLALVDLIRKMPLLQELTIGFTPTSDEPILLSKSVGADLDQVLGDLTTLNLDCSDVLLAQRSFLVYENTFYLRNSSGLSLPPLPTLRHLVIVETSLGERHNIDLTSFKDTLETPSFRFFDDFPSAYGSVISAPFPHLTHLQLGLLDAEPSLAATLSILSFTHNLRHLDLINGPSMSDIVPFLPSTVTSIHNHVEDRNGKPRSKNWLKTQLEACARHSSPLELLLFINMDKGEDFASFIKCITGGAVRALVINACIRPLWARQADSTYLQNAWYMEDATWKPMWVCFEDTTVDSKQNAQDNSA